jgi:hypothetical protein
MCRVGLGRRTAAKTKEETVSVASVEGKELQTGKARLVKATSSHTGSRNTSGYVRVRR